jgi:hypothetical protein
MINRTTAPIPFENLSTNISIKIMALYLISGEIGIKRSSLADLLIE